MLPLKRVAQLGATVTAAIALIGGFSVNAQAANGFLSYITADGQEVIVPDPSDTICYTTSDGGAIFADNGTDEPITFYTDSNCFGGGITVPVGGSQHFDQPQHSFAVAGLPGKAQTRTHA
ncbi:hypothetical protein ACFP1Z_00320 [Streptomyces gamaensis]|uniref:Uncharacterized protein n=1 Tax=Streptomyces gamaensis TaxID=1763542 RepID=A0ABW0YTN0_9ACTN